MSHGQGGTFLHPSYRIPMTDELMDEAKARLRREALSRRAAIGAADRAEAAVKVARHFFDRVPVEPGDIVGGYWPLREELDCLPILTRLVDSGFPVALPVAISAEAPLTFRRWLADQPLYPAGFGSLAPADGAPVVAPSLVLVPLLGFDRHGMRLGYGGGYYDRTLGALSSAARRIGLAYDRQRFEVIPRGPHDVPLDAVITESGLVSFAAEAA